MGRPRVWVVTTRSSVARQWLTKRYVARLTVNFAKLSNAVIASVAALQQLGRYRGDSVAKRFWALERRKLFPDQGRIGNFDSKIHPFGF